MKGAVAGGVERSEVEGSDQRRIGVIRGGGQRSEDEGSDQRWGGKRSGLAEWQN